MTARRPPLLDRVWASREAGQNGEVRPHLVTEQLPPARGRLVTLRRVVTSVLLAVAGAGLYLAFTLHDDAPSPRLGSGVVKTVSPQPGTIQLRQTEVFAELDASHQASMVINNKPIPDDQLAVIEGLNRVSYTPGPGKEVEALPAGLNCAVVRFRPVPGATGTAGSYRWCFSVH